MSPNFSINLRSQETRLHWCKPKIKVQSFFKNAKGGQDGNEMKQKTLKNLRKSDLFFQDFPQV